MKIEIKRKFGWLRGGTHSVVIIQQEHMKRYEKEIKLLLSKI